MKAFISAFEECHPWMTCGGLSTSLTANSLLKPLEESAGSYRGKNVAQVWRGLKEINPWLNLQRRAPPIESGWVQTPHTQHHTHTTPHTHAKPCTTYTHISHTYIPYTQTHTRNALLTTYTYKPHRYHTHTHTPLHTHTHTSKSHIEHKDSKPHTYHTHTQQTIYVPQTHTIHIPHTHTPLSHMLPTHLRPYSPHTPHTHCAHPHHILLGRKGTLYH